MRFIRDQDQPWSWDLSFACAPLVVKRKSFQGLTGHHSFSTDLDAGVLEREPAAKGAVMNFATTWEVKVRWGDCDAANIVFYPNFFRWLDSATWHHFEEAGLPMQKLMRRHDGFGMPAVDARLAFRSPGRDGDLLKIITRVLKWNDKTFEIEHKVYNGSTLSAEGMEIRAWCVRDKDNPEVPRAAAIPAEVPSHFAKLRSHGAIIREA